jgi:hypothetical protein
MTGKDRKSKGSLYEVETKGRTMGKKKRDTVKGGWRGRDR